MPTWQQPITAVRDDPIRSWYKRLHAIEEHAIFRAWRTLPTEQLLCTKGGYSLYMTSYYPLRTNISKAGILLDRRTSRKP
jgi:hypothetical protein